MSKLKNVLLVVFCVGLIGWIGWSIVSTVIRTFKAVFYFGPIVGCIIIVVVALGGLVLGREIAKEKLEETNKAA